LHSSLYIAYFKQSGQGAGGAMTDDNVIDIDGRQPVQLRKDQAEREKREEILRQKLKIVGFELQPGNAPGTYTIAHPHPPQPAYLNGWRDLSLDQVEDATSDIEVGQDPRFGCGTLRAVGAGKPWRQELPDCHVERLDALKHYYYALSDMRAELVSIREGLSSPESEHLTHAHPSLSGLSEHITAAIVLLECAEDKTVEPSAEGGICLGDLNAAPARVVASCGPPNCNL
jgi:hypothetical protein